MKKVLPTPIPDLRQILDTELLGQVIRAARTHQGLTLEQASVLSGVSLGTFVAAENKTDTLKWASLLKILHSLGVGLKIGQFMGQALTEAAAEGDDGWF